MRPKHVTRGYGLVLLAAMLWASMGLLYRSLMENHGLRPLTIVFLRAGVAALALLLALVVIDRSQLRLRRRDVPLFVSFGLVGVALFYAIYIYAVDLAGVGVAAVLMYTSPAWVTLCSVLFLGERLTWLKAVSLALALVGAGLVGRVYDLVGLRVQAAGILAGLSAGVAYAAYVLFCKAIAKRGYSPRAALAYGLAIGALFLAPWQDGAELLGILASPSALVQVLVLGLVLTLGAGVAFNEALGILPASVVSIVATVEPVMAMLLGSLVFGEVVGWPQACGAALILLAVALLQRGVGARRGIEAGSTAPRS